MASEAHSRRIRVPAIVVITLVTVVLLVFSYAGGRGLFPATPAAPAETLRIALASTPDAALVHIAAAKGYFAEEGLAVSFTLVSHGKVALDLLAQGKADLAAAADVPFVISVLVTLLLELPLATQARPPAIVASTLAWALLVAAIVGTVTILIGICVLPVGVLLCLAARSAGNRVS